MQVELARKYEDLELFRNYSHPQFELKKARKKNTLPILLDYILRCSVAQLICVLQREVLKSRNKEVVDLFENGIGIHHAGMLRADRGLTERLFSDGLLKVSCPLVMLIFLPHFI